MTFLLPPGIKGLTNESFWFLAFMYRVSEKRRILDKLFEWSAKGEA